MSEQTVAPTAAAPPGSVHELLRQLVESHFVLTDRDGAVTRWSAPAQALFGWEPHGMLGRPMLETLGVAVSPPRHGGRLTASTRLRDRREIEVELVFIPVRMSQSLEFNGFLSALEQMSAAALSVERLRSGHYGVVDWIEAAMNGEGTLEDDELAAGTIVTFRPTTPIDFFDDDQDDERYDELDDFDDIERALAGTATSVEEARTDAAAARSEAAVASERVGTLEAQLEQTRALVETLQGELTAGRGATAEETAALVESLRTELQQTRGATEEGTAALVESLREELEQTRGATEQSAAALVESLREELHEPQPEQDAIVELREGLDKVRKRVRQASEQDFGAQIEAMRSELSVLRANSTEDARRDSEALEQLIADVEQQAKDARKAAGRVEEAAARAGAHAQTAAAVGQQIDEKVARVEEAALKVDQGEQHATRAEEVAAMVEAAAQRAEEASATNAAAIEAAAQRAEAAAEKAERQFEEAAARAEQAAAAAERHLEEAREAAEQAALEAEVARVQAEAAQTRPRRRARTSAGAPSANGTADLHAPLFGREDDKGPERELRTGFDDVKEPMATIALDGHFRELNKSFSELVGYKEKEFAACTWPPVMDRANLPKHREQMRALMAGEATSVDVNTGYVHAQGLLVPVVGKLSLRRTDGQPDHFLLELVRP